MPLKTYLLLPIAPCSWICTSVIRFCPHEANSKPVQVITAIFACSQHFCGIHCIILCGFKVINFFSAVLGTTKLWVKNDVAGSLPVRPWGWSFPASSSFRESLAFTGTWYITPVSTSSQGLFPLGVALCVSVLFSCKGTSHWIRLTLIQNDLIITNYICKDVLYK